jgi:hypothetical protein
VAIWLPAGIGLATIPSLRATLARWKAEDEADAQPEAVVTPLPVVRYPAAAAPACAVPVRREPIAA